MNWKTNKRSLRALIKSRIFLFSGLLLILVTACGDPENAGSSGSVIFYAGSNKGNLEYSIFLCELDPVTLELSVIDSFPGIKGSGYLDISPDGLTLFSTSGSGLSDDEGRNSVAAYRVSQEDHSLELINRQSSQGRGNCHVQCSPDGSYVFAANYSSGHAAALPVEESGSLRAATSVVIGEGSGPVVERQEGPHAHQAMMDPEGKFLLVPDLGTDKVMNYILNYETGVLSPNPNQPFLKMEPGSGPRHLAFHPTKNLVYILSELNATITACTFDPASGVLSLINSASIVEDGFDGKRQSAAVRVHPNGKYVYASNRDDESNLAVFSLNEAGGLTKARIVEGVPYWPRDFNITPDGKYILVAGARSNEIVLYQVDPETGMLSGTGVRTDLPGITSIVFPQGIPMVP